MADYSVTPWEVKGDVDYDRLVRDFGTSYIDQSLMNRVEKHTGKPHFMLKRKVFLAIEISTGFLTNMKKTKNSFYTREEDLQEIHI